MAQSPRSLSRQTVTLSLLAALVIASVLVGFPWFAPQKAQAALGAGDDAKIKEVIYPTFGNPAMAAKGDTFVVEFDPRHGAVTFPIPNAEDFVVTVRTSVDTYPLTASLPVESSALEASKVWPNLWNFPVWRVTVRVPLSLPEHLYDLTVQAKVNGSTVTDTQPHALQALDEFKKDFSFCQLSDVHVFGSECSYPSSNQKERNNRHTDYRPDDDGYGAKYYHKTIDQLNRIKPDFCVYTGDYMFGQAYFTKDQGAPWGTTTEYEYEQLWFYQETLALEVPVFLLPGNHDGYSEGSGEGANEDWLNNWQKIWGPLYYSFDYGNSHFTMCNSMDWTTGDRDLSNLLLIFQPSHYKGQFRGGGDGYADGVSDQRFSALDESTYTAQLAWMRDDLIAHSSSNIRVMAMHHEPWKDAGSGSMWKNDPVIGMGNGQGRLASLKLMKDHNVSLVLTGHDHSDWRGTLPWTAGGGEVLFVNTTSVSFQADGDSDVYPGYQRIEIADGAVASHFYQSPKWAYPSYAGVNVGGSTNLGGLSTPAVESTWSTPPGSATDVTNNLNNHLATDFPRAYVEFPMPYLTGGYYYVLQNGTLEGYFDNKASSPDHRTYQVRASLPAGEAKSVRMLKSASPDRSAPTGTVKINNGADTTTSLDVTLDIIASDTGGSGLKEMMVSNRSDFEGASWEAYSSNRPWRLVNGDIGARKVYVKVRDGAMPGNEKALSGSIVYCFNIEPTGPSKTWYFAEGCTRQGFEEWLSLQNPGYDAAKVTVTYMDSSGHNQAQSINVASRSRKTVNVNEAAGPDKDISVRIDSTVPILVERPMYFNYQGMWDGGHNVIGTCSPKTRWYFSEGSTQETSAFNAHTWLCLQNPQPRDVKATITYMLQSGEPVSKSVTLRARSRTTECANWDVGPGKDVSIMVESDDAIVCERPMYFTYKDSWDGGHVVLGTGAPANDWYFAEGTSHGGYQTYICVQNPGNEEAGVTLTYMLDQGSANPQKIKVPARSRRTVCVNDWVGPAKNMSARVHSDRPVVAERSMYFNYMGSWDGGTCVSAAAAPHTWWAFAEGCTREGFDEILSIQNPGDQEAIVKIAYLVQGATTEKKQEIKIPKRSRQTVMVNDFLKGDYDVSAVVTSSIPIVVERPMYFNYMSRYTGGHCVVGRGDD